MKRMKHLFGILIIELLLSALPACSAPKSSRSPYVPPAVPSYIGTQQGAINYLALHFWQKFPLSEIDVKKDTAYLEQAFADFAQYLLKTDREQLSKAMVNMLQKAQTDTVRLHKFLNLSDHYLYNPNSPMRNEEAYIPVLAYIDTSKLLPEIEKVRPRYRLGLALKNRIGEVASDFQLTQLNGSNLNLYQIEAPLTLLYFNNPGCHACAEISAQLKSIELFSKPNRLIKIVAAYPDKDLDEWKKHANDFPPHWINAYNADRKLMDLHLYDLKAIPCLYLLDEHKRVILKDVSTQDLIKYLNDQGLL